MAEERIHAVGMPVDAREVKNGCLHTIGHFDRLPQLGGSLRAVIQLLTMGTPADSVGSSAVMVICPTDFFVTQAAGSVVWSPEAYGDVADTPPALSPSKAANPVCHCQ